MKRFLVCFMSGLIVSIGAAAALDNPIKKRQALMDRVGKAADQASKMLKGELPYDAAQLEAGMKMISGSADEFVTLFPDGSEPAPGVETDALPEIWLDKEDFASRAAKLKEDAAKAAAAAPGGMEAFVPTFVALGQTCSGCHEKYRVKR